MEIKCLSPRPPGEPGLITTRHSGTLSKQSIWTVFEVTLLHFSLRPALYVAQASLGLVSLFSRLLECGT